jgi:hypothetical protein
LWQTGEPGDGLDGQPQGVDAHHRSSQSRNQAPQALNNPRFEFSPVITPWMPGITPTCRADLDI